MMAVSSPRSTERLLEVTMDEEGRWLADDKHVGILPMSGPVLGMKEDLDFYIKSMRGHCQGYIIGEKRYCVRTVLFCNIQEQVDPNTSTKLAGYLLPSEDRFIGKHDVRWRCASVAKPPSLLIMPGDSDQKAMRTIEQKHLAPQLKASVANGYMLGCAKKEIATGTAFSVVYGMFLPI